VDIPVSANNEKGFWSKVSDFLGQANRSFGLFDSWVPSRESFEGGVKRLLGPCFQNCDGHNALVQSTTDVMQGAGQGVAEAANRYYPEVAKNMAASAVPLEALAAKALSAGEKFFEGATLHARVIKQMGTNDYHAFPQAIDELAKRNGTVATVLDSRGKPVQMLTYKGEYDGKMGTFEYIKNSSNQIYHRFFDPRKP
jgi:hypothetical protein